MERSHQRTIAFAMLSETGHYTGTFRLARSLRARGHRIVYVGIADFEQLVRAQGFEFIPFAADLLPVGYVGKFTASQSDPDRGVLGRWQKRWSDERLFAAYLRRIEDGRLDECLLSCKPDLLLCDTFVWYIAIRALRLGIPTISISIILSLYPNARIPPIVSPIHPRQTWWSALRVLGSWKWLRLKFFFSKRLASILLGLYRFPTRMHHLVDVFLRVAKRSGYPCEENKTYWFGEMGPRLVLPEIVLCPEAFQLPGSPADGRRYLGDFVDIERREELLAADALDSEKPLVYASLGTSAFFYPHAPRFFKAVADASRLRKDWQFVLHVGDHPEAWRLGPPGPNLLIRKRVPQLALLRRASVMMTHGGLNSIMECIHFGVPMVIIPGLRDQPGNATRAVHHNLAVTTSMARITPGILVSLAAHAMEDTAIRQGLARMKRQIADEKGMGANIRFIESFPESLSGCRNSV
jgi:zeaxanthin glucosyltransferase